VAGGEWIEVLEEGERRGGGNGEGRRKGGIVPWLLGG